MLDIVIISYGTKDMTLQCIESIKQNTDIPYHIFVVDNASKDDSVQALRQISDITLIENQENLGYGKACNQGARAGNSPNIIFLNSDILAKPNWVKPLINCLNQSDDIAVVSPKLLTQNGLIAGAGVVGTNANPFLRGFMQYDNGEYNKQIDCISVCGAAFMIKRSNIPTLGLFDESYHFYFEETDYCYNARDKGFRVVYCPNSHMIHHFQGSCKDNNVLNQYFRESQIIFNKKFNSMMEDSRFYG